MPESPKPNAPLSDDDLLANATPIDPDADQESDEDDELKPIDYDDGEDRENLSDAEAGGDSRGGSKIRSFGVANESLGQRQWTRQPTATGHGASHVRTFFGKLRPDSIHHIDDQINQWLDDHPDYEVKFVNTTHGILKGKTDEEALIVSVWV